jgi:hypothetical protein
MAQAKKASKRVVQIGSDEALDRLLEAHERRAAKKKKQVTPDEAMDLLLAEHDRKAAKRKAAPVGALADVGQQAKKKVKREVEPGGTLLALEDKKEEPSGALVSKKAKTVATPAVKKAKVSKSKKGGVSGSQRRKQYAT